MDKDFLKVEVHNKWVESATQEAIDEGRVIDTIEFTFLEPNSGEHFIKVDVNLCGCVQRSSAKIYIDDFLAIAKMIETKSKIALGVYEYWAKLDKLESCCDKCKNDSCD